MYRVLINTNYFKNLPYNKKSWELGQINDYMHAINGWNVIENDITELNWRLDFFLNGSSPREKYNKHSENHSKAQLWDARSTNSVTYHVRALVDKEQAPSKHGDSRRVTSH